MTSTNNLFRVDSRTAEEIHAEFVNGELIALARRRARFLKAEAEIRAKREREAAAMKAAVKTPVAAAVAETAPHPVFKGIVAVANPAETARIRAENAKEAAREAQRKAARELAAKPIPVEVLSAGLEADRAAEAARRVEEAEAARRLAEGYRKDVFATALSIGNSQQSFEQKIFAMESAGFEFVANAKNGKDAEYYHHKSGVKFFLRGGADATPDAARPHKPVGCEKLKLTAEEHAANLAKKLAMKAAAKAGKAPKQTPAQIKKAEEKAKKAAAAAAKAAKKRK